MARNHVWRYTLRLFHILAIFEKYRKINAKKDAQSCHFWSKMRPWVPKDRLIQPFWSIFENSKNRSFFVVALGLDKSIINRALGEKGGEVPRAGTRARDFWGALYTTKSYPSTNYIGSTFRNNSRR